MQQQLTHIIIGLIWVENEPQRIRAPSLELCRQFFASTGQVTTEYPFGI